MGKKQYSKDRMYITTTEWATEWGGAKSKELSTPFQRLPFYCCSLTFTPFEDPVCTSDGSVFEIMNIIPYVRKHGKHPVTGALLKQEDLIPLTFHKNSEGEYHCPVLNKVFTEFTHIVAVRTTGNVFCDEAIKELNLKVKNWKELLTDEPFTREDLITIQNPNALDSKALLEFDHVKKGLKLDDEELKKMSSDPTYNINVSGDIKDMLKELGTEKGKQTALHGGGGDKAQNEIAAALTAILAARSRIKDESESKKNGEVKSVQPFSIVDAASASVNGRSAAAAKSTSSDKTAARIAMHMAGERAPVNAKLEMGNPNIKIGSDSSSGEEDGDADRRAAIASIVATSSFALCSSSTNGGLTATPNSNHSIEEPKTELIPPKPKHYQIKAQKILDDILEKTIEIVSDPIHVVDNEPKIDEGGIRLFRRAPPGIVFDYRDEVQRPKRRPKILPGEEINEKSKKFREQIQSVAVDGMSIIVAAQDACQKSLARLQDKEARAKAAAKREEERVAELKRIRGERWLPSIAREKQSTISKLKSEDKK